MPVQSDMRARVGMAKASDGSEDSVRAGRTLEQIVSDAHGRYYDPTVNGNVFSLMLTATSSTIAAGNIAAAAAAASTQFALWNPAGSGKNLALLKFGIVGISGTMPIPPLMHGLFIGSTPSIASVGAAVNNSAGGTAPAARYVASAAGTTLTGGPAPTNLRVADIAFSAGSYANLAANGKGIEEIAGDIVIPPGNGWVPLWMAGGTTFLNAYSITWEEIPV